MTGTADVLLTRRVLAAAAAATTTGLEAMAESASALNKRATGLVPVALRVNDTDAQMELEPPTTLLDALRGHLRLTGSKKGCDHGQCGACTVLVNGRRIYSCLTLAVMHQGDTVVTIEGLGQPDALHPMQAAFIKHDGYQCGYCTPGQICASGAALQEIAAGMPSHVTADLLAPPQVTPEEIRERMSGNICRCGTRVRRMLAVCAALMEELAVDHRHGFFVNHDLAGYEVPVHADIPRQEVIFLDEVDPISSPMKAQGVAELGICGVGAAVANAIHNATGARVRDYPIRLDKLLPHLPEMG